MAETSIEWVISPDGSQGHTVNPIRFRNLETGKIGHHCEKISAGCKNCYASAMQKPYLSGLEFTAKNREKGEFFLDQAALESVLRRRTPTTWFWCDMTDMFGSWVPDEWIDRCFAVMALTPQHRHIVLTKRAKRMAEYCEKRPPAQAVVDLADALNLQPRCVRPNPYIPPGRHWWPIPNAILGVSCEDQAAADERIPHLLRTPAACRMVSMEPLLGDVRLWKLQSLDYHDNSIGYETYPLSGRQAMPDCDWKHPRLDWVIVGGESGPGARPMHPDWARSLRDQCTVAGVPFFFKQWGEWAPSEPGKESVIIPGMVPDGSVGPDRCHWLWPDGEHFPVGAGVTGIQLPNPEVLTLRVGKKHAGRLLDGRVWDERPEVLNG